MSNVVVGLGSLEECAGDAGFLGAKEGSIQIVRQQGVQKDC